MIQSKQVEMANHKSKGYDAMPMWWSKLLESIIGV